MKTMNIRVSKDGLHVTVEAEGYTGNDCMDEVKKITVGLGSIIDEHTKPSYYGSNMEGVYAGTTS